MPPRVRAASGLGAFRAALARARTALETPGPSIPTLSRARVLLAKFPAPSFRVPLRLGQVQGFKRRRAGSAVAPLGCNRATPQRLGAGTVPILSRIATTPRVENLPPARRGRMAGHAPAGRGFIHRAPPAAASAAETGTGRRPGGHERLPPFRPKGQRAPPIPGDGFRRGCRRRAASLASFVISTGDNGDTGDNGGFLRVWRCPRWFRGTGDTGDRLGGLGGTPCAPPCQEAGGAGHT